MFTKFKILPVVALGICWMAMGDVAMGDGKSSLDCKAAYQQCKDEYKKPAADRSGWNACEGYKNAYVHGPGYGLSFIACCVSGSAAENKPWPEVRDCTNNPDCMTADRFCPLYQNMTPSELGNG